MKKFKSKNKGNFKYNNLSKIIVFTLFLIILVTFFLFSKFIKINENIIKISEAEINKVTYNFINERINYNILNDKALKDILKITRNKNDEILYVDFNLDTAYALLDKISGILIDSLKELENGNIRIAYFDEEASSKTNSLVLHIPIGAVFKNSYFYNLGPKIPVKINYVGSVLTNLETKITNYGLNNALVEVFAYIEFHNDIITFGKYKNLDFNYNVLIASMMLEGSVPSFYGGSISKEASLN